MPNINLNIPTKVCDKKNKGEKIKNIFLTNSNTQKTSISSKYIDSIYFDLLGFVDEEMEQILELIWDCEVENIIIVLNANCRDIDEKNLELRKDISKDIFNKYDALIELVENFKINQGKEKKLSFYCYIVKQNAYDIPVFTLSDLFEESTKNDSIKALINETISPTQRKNSYYHKYNITSSFSKLKGFFGINSAAYFYQVHKEILGQKDFVYQDKVYGWNQEQEKLSLKLPAWAKNIKFIGDDYYEIEESIDAKGVVTGHKLISRKRSTLKNRFGNDFADYFKDYYYHGFANIPDNFNYKPVHHNYYNRYSEISYKPKKGEIKNVLSMVKHIFGEEKIKHNKKTLKRYEIALDYIQILITEPTHPLPILILFSVERETGKSTFPEFLKMILGTNSVKVGNKAFDSEFNEIFADKLLIWCDETLLDRKQQAEKIKDLSTSKHILVNPKGTGQYEIPFFGKFIFTSNNRRMVYVDKNSVRFWINKVSPLKNDDPLFIEKLEKEIPAFLHFLQNRKLVTKRETRMHFNAKWIKTDALEETVKVNEPRDVAHLRESIKERFLDIPENGEEIKMTLTDINDEFFGGRKDKPWIKEILTDYFEIKPNAKSDKSIRYQYWRLDKEEKKPIYKEKGNKNGKPTSVENTGEVEYSQNITKVNKSGRPYTFKKAYFIKNLENSKEN